MLSLSELNHGKAMNMSTAKNSLIHRSDEAEVDVATAWQSKLRKAVFDGVSEADIKEIVANQIKAAKAGDRHAIKWVTEYILGGKGPQVSINRSVFVDARRRPKRTDAIQGTPAKVTVLANRAANGRALFNAADGQE